MVRLTAFSVAFSLLALPSLYAQIPDPPGKVEGQYDVPVLEGETWNLVGVPDLGPQYNNTDNNAKRNQEPVDFAVWQAADGSWQLTSCIRHTNYGGKTRLLYRWEGKDINEPNWEPAGIAMTSDESLGETHGGLQAPHVVLHDGVYHMLYGDFNNICLAVSDDGKNFTRVIQPNGKTAMYNDGAFTRDPMAIKINDLWYVYTTSDPLDQCVIRCRTSPDLRNWSKYNITVASGGLSGPQKRRVECPQVIKHNDLYYLLRTETYRGGAKTHVYVSSDPLHFGQNRDEWYYATTLPIAAPEYVLHDGKEYLVYLNPELDGIRAQRLGWTPAKPRDSSEVHK